MVFMIFFFIKLESAPSWHIFRTGSIVVKVKALGNQSVSFTITIIKSASI
jgi:hypothetical protein